MLAKSKINLFLLSDFKIFNVDSTSLDHFQNNSAILTIAVDFQIDKI